MLTDALLAWIHFLLAFLVVGTLVAEAFILRLPVDGRVARLLTRVDLFYGIAAGLLVIAGVSRIIWGARGWAYYQSQPFFWAKIAAFAVIGLISIAPTLAFMRWRKAAVASDFVVPEADVRRVRRLVVAETHMIALLLLFAALMARGIGG